jgi:hypothetical protein
MFVIEVTLFWDSARNHPRQTVLDMLDIDEVRYNLGLSEKPDEGYSRHLFVL